MTTQKRKAQQHATFRLAIGIQIAEHGQALPASVYIALERRALKLGMKLSDLEIPPTRK